MTRTVPENEPHVAPRPYLPVIFESPQHIDEARIREKPAQIEQTLASTFTPVLDTAAQIKERVRLIDALRPIVDQSVQQKRRGAPPRGTSEAARRLPLGRHGTAAAKRLFVQRALRIAAISQAAKAEIRVLELDDHQTALLAVAAGETEHDQIAIARSCAERSAHRGKRPHGEHAVISGFSDLPADQKREFKEKIEALCDETGLALVWKTSRGRRT